MGDPGSTFSEGPNVTKVYMTFILAFVGITNIIVSNYNTSNGSNGVLNPCVAVHWLDDLYDLVRHRRIDCPTQ